MKTSSWYTRYPLFVGWITALLNSSRWSFRRLMWLAVYTLIACSLAEAFVLVPLVHLQFESDTGLVVTGVDAIRRCLDNGTFQRCPGVSRLPPLQYIPIFMVNVAGISPVPVLTLLSVLSSVGLMGTLMRVLRRPATPGAPALAAAAWFGGYGIWYVQSTFAEALAAFLVTIAVAACHRRRPVAAAVGMFFAAMSKEPAGFFLVVLGALALMLRPTGVVRPARTTALMAMVGVTSGIACNAAFNIFRYGTVLNRGYLEAGYRVSGWDRRAEYFAAQWISPNGGVLLFAPILCLAVVVALRSHTPDVFARWVARVAVCIPVALAVGFSHWYSPMGWWGYGSRYLMPWLPATLLLVLLAQGDAWARWAQKMGRWRYLALSIGLAVLALPHVVAIVDGTEYTRFSDANPECVHILDVLADPVGQARSMHCHLFPHRYILPLENLFHAPAHLLLSLSYITVLVMLLHRAKAASHV